MTFPVIYAASSDTKNETAAATSSGFPKRCIGIMRDISFWSKSAVISVSMKPGATAFTVTFRFAISFANAFVPAITPPLAAE